MSLCNFAVIITYNPELEHFRHNLGKMRAAGIKCLVIDNGSHNFEEIRKVVSDFSGVCICNGENLGVAAALNQALDYAKIHSIPWLWTFDQDTEITEGICQKFDIAIECLRNENLIALVANHIDRATGRAYDQPLSNTQPYPLMRTSITSGSLLNVSLAQQLGGFANSYFIDFVDHEFYLRARRAGYMMRRVDAARVWHSVGDIRQFNIIGFKLGTTNHGAVRRYYIARNTLRTSFNYFWVDPWFNFKSLLTIFYSFFAIFLFEDGKIKKLQGLIIGLMHAFSGVTGKISPEIEKKLSSV